MQAPGVAIKEHVIDYFFEIALLIRLISPMDKTAHFTVFSLFLLK